MTVFKINLHRRFHSFDFSEKAVRNINLIILFISMCYPTVFILIIQPPIFLET